MKGYPQDYEVDGQMSLFDDAKARVKPGQRFIYNRKEYEVIEVRGDKAIIKPVETGLPTSCSASGLLSISRIIWL